MVNLEFNSSRIFNVLKKLSFFLLNMIFLFLITYLGLESFHNILLKGHLIKFTFFANIVSPKLITNVTKNYNLRIRKLNVS